MAGHHKLAALLHMSKNQVKRAMKKLWDHGQAETGATHMLALAFNGYEIRAKKGLLVKIL